jgi:hypothetical protein
VDVNSVPPIGVSITGSSFFGSAVQSDPMVQQGLSVEGGAINVALDDVGSSLEIARCQFDSNSAVAGRT